MHFAFAIYLAICVEILAITAVLHFLMKATKEGVGGLLKWVGYIALVAGFLIMLCTFTQGIMRMAHHGGGDGCDGYCGKGHMMMMHGGMCCGDGNMSGCSGDKGCAMDSNECKGMHGMGGMKENDKMMMDSTGKMGK